MIRVQEHDFSLEVQYQALRDHGRTGAIVTFTGLVRDFNPTDRRFFLQHYPAMTEKVLKNIVNSAKTRFDIESVHLIHRVGHLQPSDQIVFVGVSSAHRGDAFSACEFIMDVLKTEAPFWKKEGDAWVAAKESDQRRKNTWLEKTE